MAQDLLLSICIFGTDPPEDTPVTDMPTPGDLSRRRLVLMITYGQSPESRGVDLFLAEPHDWQIGPSASPDYPIQLELEGHSFLLPEKARGPVGGILLAWATGLVGVTIPRTRLFQPFAPDGGIESSGEPPTPIQIPGKVN